MPEKRIFVSYSRKDADYSAYVRCRLEAEKLTICQDISHMEAGQWWKQITEILKADTTEHMVLLVSSDSLASKVVRDEWLFARREGVQVSPVIVPGRLESKDFAKMPSWMRAEHFFNFDMPGQFDNLVKGLHGPSSQVRVPMMAPAHEEDFVLRSEEGDKLLAHLLEGGNAVVGITAALRGAGGYGKTQLARWLCHQESIEDAFYDGVLWLEFGEKPDVLGLIEDLIKTLTGKPGGFTQINSAANCLKELLEKGCFLLVLDDLWRQQDLAPFHFEIGAPHVVRLITTRINDILPRDTARVLVDAMKLVEAVKLLAAGLPSDKIETQHVALRALASRLGEWALLLTLANAVLRVEIEEGATVGEAIAYAGQLYDNIGLTAFDSWDEDSRNSAVALSIGVSLGRLDKEREEVARFEELALYPEDEHIPATTIIRIWSVTGGLSSLEGKILLRRLKKWALLMEYDRRKGTVRLHDVMRRYLLDRIGKKGLRKQNNVFLKAYDGISGSELKGEEQLYFFRRLPLHLHQAGKFCRLRSLLCDPDWMIRKLAALRTPQPLIEDYRNFASDYESTESFIGRALILSAESLARDQRQLIPHLLGRLGSLDGKRALQLVDFLKKTRLSMLPPALILQRPSLTPPGAELARLTGHQGPIHTLALLPNGLLASGSSDKTIRLWSTLSGAELACFSGHQNAVTALAFLSDNRLASGSDDQSLRLWDLGTGAMLACFTGHEEGIGALVVLPDGRLASGSGDNTVRLWDPDKGTEVALLTGHEGSVDALVVLPNGDLASGSRDNTIRIWDLNSGIEQRRFTGHKGCVRALVVLPDDLLASCSDDKTIRIWDLGTGAELTRLTGHQGPVHALAVRQDGLLASGEGNEFSRFLTIRLWNPRTSDELSVITGHEREITSLMVLPDGRLASSSYDRTIRLWSLSQGTKQTNFKNHKDGVRAVVMLSDDRLASSSYDKTIRLWDTSTGDELKCLKGHQNRIRALVALPNGYLASGSDDNTVRIWDPETGTELSCLKGHEDWVRALVALPNNCLASGSSDRTIRLWDLSTGAELNCFTGHDREVTALKLLPNGHLISSSWDSTVRTWDLNMGLELACLTGHKKEVSAVAILPDGRLATASWDNTIRIWDPNDTIELARLVGHEEGVAVLIVLQDGRLASGSYDHSIRLWDPNTSAELVRLELDASVSCLAQLPDGNTLVAGDAIGNIHWLEIFDNIKTPSVKS